MTEEKLDTEIDVRTSFQKLLRFWWVLAVGIILGGLLGWLFSLLQPPVYEATAHYDVDLYEEGLINRLGLEGPEQLVFLIVDPYLKPVADLFYAPDIRAEVIAVLAGDGIQIEPQDFITRTFILDRRGYVWFVSVRDTDPDRAIRMTDEWLRTVDERLHEFRTHAFTAQDLQLQLDLVLHCFETASLPEGNLCAGTSFKSLDEYGTYLNEVTEQLASELAEARGVDPLVDFYILRTAEASATPMLYSRANLLIAGALVGLILALFLVLGGFIRHSSRLKQ